MHCWQGASFHPLHLLCNMSSALLVITKWSDTACSWIQLVKAHSNWNELAAEDTHLTCSLIHHQPSSLLLTLPRADRIALDGRLIRWLPLLLHCCPLLLMACSQEWAFAGRVSEGQVRRKGMVWFSWWTRERTNHGNSSFFSLFLRESDFFFFFLYN